MDDGRIPYLFRAPRSTPESRGGRPPEHRLEHRPGMVIEKDIAVPYGPGPRPLRRRLPSRERRAGGTAGELVAVRQAQPRPDRPDLPEQRGPTGVDVGPDHVRGAGPGVLGPARLRHRPRRRAGHLVLRGPGHLLLAGGGTRLRRPGGVGRHPALERGEGRAVRGLLPVEPAVVRRRAEPAAPRRDQPVGGVERHLPGGRPARRDPGDLLLALHLGAMGGQHHRDRGPGVRDRAHPWYDEFWAARPRTSRPSACRRSWWPAGRTRGCTPAARSRASGAWGRSRSGSTSTAARSGPTTTSRRTSSASAPSSTTSCSEGHRHRGPGRACAPRCGSGTRRAAGGRPGNGRSRTSSTRSSTWTPPTDALSWEPAPPRALPPTTGWAAGWLPAGPRSASRFAEPVELVGHVRAVLHMSADEAEDMDVFVALFKLDAEGNQVGFPYYAQFEDGPVAVGWLRASHRELDPERSTDYLPVLAHRRALPLTPARPPGWTSRSGRRAPASRRGSSCCWSSRAAT